MIVIDACLSVTILLVIVVSASVISLSTLSSIVTPNPSLTILPNNSILPSSRVLSTVVLLNSKSFTTIVKFPLFVCKNLPDTTVPPLGVMLVNSGFIGTVVSI